MIFVCKRPLVETDGAVRCAVGQAYRPEELPNGAVRLTSYANEQETLTVDDLLLDTFFSAVADYLVVETADGLVTGYTFCDTMDEAIDEANEMLADHAKTLSREKEFWMGDGRRADWDEASSDFPHAWCDWGDTHWMAYIVEF